MSNVLTHRFTSPKLDGPDLTQVQPSAWNDGHQFSGGANNDVLTRDTTDATFGAKWTTPAAPAGWVAYTPVWWIGGTVVSVLGNHTFTSANYFRQGSLVLFQVLLAVGTDPLPSGGWQFGLPFASTALVGSGGGLAHTASGEYPLFLSSYGFADRVSLLYLPSGLVLAPFTAFAPATLGGGAFVEIRGNFQAA